MGYPDWWPDVKKRGPKVAARFSNQNRTERAVIGLRVDEQKEKTRVAMKITSGNKERETQSLSYRDLGYGRKEDEACDPSNEGSLGNPFNKGKGHVELQKPIPFYSPNNFCLYFEWLNF